LSSSSSVVDPGDPFLPGNIFAGKYRIEKVLGRGGMGLVLAARHLGLDEPVAIKVLLPAMMQAAGMIERFMREARASAKIKNDHVVRVTDVDTLPSGVPYMVMERLEGADLSDLCKSVGPLPIADAVRYLLETCSAIGEAHEMGIIHRDLKPANLFLARRRDGATSIKVLDFGISKAMQSLGENTVTVAGTVLGSPSYMSPEQIAAVRDLDGRTDLWSLGVILYQLVTGRVPFPADTLTQLCALVLQTEPRRPSELRPDLPPGLEAVILRCLEKDRARRFGTAGDLAAALLPFAGPLPMRPGSMPSIETTMPITPYPAVQSVSSLAMSESAPIASSVMPVRAREKSPAWIIGLVATLGALGLGGAGAFWFLNRPRPIAPSSASSASSAPIPIVDAISTAPAIAAAPATSSAPIEIAIAPAASASGSPAPEPSASASAPHKAGPTKTKTIDVGF
jgi:eukaryotic-like serine/threonine-protein kinase